MKLLLLILVVLQFLSLSFSQYNPLQDPYTCGAPVCEGNGKFNYRPGTFQDYKYSIETRSLFNGTSKNESTLYIEGSVSLTFLTPCDGLLTLSDIKLSENIPRDESENLEHPNSQLFADMISEYSLRFSFKDGIISELCPQDDEKTWVLNFKRGILSMLQNTMVRFDLDHVTEEQDVRGTCPTSYKVVGAKETSLLIEKTKDLDSCSNHAKLHSLIHFTPIFNFPTKTQKEDIFKSTSQCVVSIDHNIYNEISCKEIYLLEPFSNQASGATATVVQKLILKVEGKSGITEEKNEITRREPLNYDHLVSNKPTSSDIKTARDFVKELCKRTKNDFQIELPDLFHKLIKTLRPLSQPALSALYRHSQVTCPTGKKHFLQALPFVNSAASVALMKDIILTESLSEATVNEWIMSIAFIAQPDEEMIMAALKLLEEKTFTTNMALSVAALTRTYCNQHPDCPETDAVLGIAQHFEKYLLKVMHGDIKGRMHQDNIIVALKAISTIGLISEDFQGKLFELIQDPNLDVGIRIAAVESFRRTPCTETTSYFERIFRNQDQDAEIRIGAYLQLMRCPNYLLIKNIRQMLINEEVNQVGAFVWSHLNNLIKTANPRKVEVQSLLSEKDLIDKFNTDIRKFSHNRDGSIYFDEYNFGGTYESNVIFSPSSYIPRTAMLNLTVDLFGESVNLLEVYGRIEGFEHYLESFFGPKGKANIIKDKMEELKMRWTRNTNDNQMIENQIDKLPNPIETNTNEPKVAVGLKVFGNDIKYATVCGDDEIQDALRTLNPANYLKRILSGKEINYNKASMFLDSSYVVPSGTGLPLSLAITGTASINIKLYGSLKSAGFSKNKEFELVANIEPAVSLDITGEMSLDAFYASTGIKLKTNMHTATAVNADIKIKGTQLVSVKFGLPKQDTRIFGASSELLVRQKEIDQPQTGLLSSQVSNAICSWPVFEQTMGLKLCTEYNFINASKIPDAPYFMLAGPAMFQWYINKSDPTARTYLFEYKWTTVEDKSLVSLTFDTPGSTIKRLLNANITIDKQGQNLTLLMESTAGTVLARGKYKNTDDEKYMQLTLDINNKKHFDTLVSYTRQKKINGYLYKPRVYLGVNGIRVLELEGTIDLLSKNDISQYTVDVKFYTKRLTSKIFGYISKKETSIDTDLYLDYKFLHTKEHRLSLKFSVANRSRKNMARIIGSCDVKSTAYPNFNFNSTVTFQSSGSHMEFKMGMIQNPLSPNDPNAEFASLKFDLLFSYKSFTDSKRTIRAVAGIKRKSSNLDLKGEVLYESINSDINVECNVNYGNNKQALVSIFWSHPRTTLEQIKAHVNVTVPSFSPMVLKVEISETHNRDYKIDASGTWFSGHSAHAIGFYQDKCTVRATNHHVKLFIKSPDFKDIQSDLQFYRDNNVLKVDFKVYHDDQHYQLFINRNSTSDVETNTEARIKYKDEVYSLTSSAYTGDYIKIVSEVHIDKIRDIDLAIWIYNQDTQKAFGFDINWDANREPNQKFLVAANFTKAGDFHYNYDLTISYPGRTVIGKYHFLLEKGHIDTLATISWDDGKSFAITLDLTYNYDKQLLIEWNSRVNTPFDNWKNVKLFGNFEHAGNKYRLDGKLSWDIRQKVALSLFGDYTALGSYFTCKYSCWITSSLDRIPNINTTIQHTQNTTMFNTNARLMYNPEFVINLDSKWKIDKNDKFTNLTGTILSETPFKGLSKGLLLSKIYFTNNKYLRGVADLDLDHKKMVVNVEGKLKKLMDSMLVVNITTPDEKYQCEFVLSKENRHFVALITYPTGNLGTEVLFNFNNFSNFDLKLFLATPVEFLQNFVVVTKYVPDQADFRLGWNFLLLGFSGVWHYANVIDFEYSYKIYTPIKDFEENGIVGKLIYKEGLDFETSIKLSYYKLGIKLVGKPKPRTLKELGINIKDFYGKPGIAKSEKNDEPLSWEGLIELDAIIYSTIKGKLEIDQKGPSYILQSKLYLPHGVATIFDEFEFIDILSMKNDLKIVTPYPTFKTVNSNFELKIIESKMYLFGVNLNYENHTKIVKTGVFAEYHVDRRELEERIYNVTLEVNTPFTAFPKLNLFGAFETEENFYHTKLLFNTNRSDISLEATTEIDGNWLELTSDVHLKTPIIYIPQCQLRLTKLFSESDNYVELTVKVPERFKSDIFLRTSWLVKSPRYKAMLRLETPFVGIENTTAGFDTYLLKEKSSMWLFAQVHPLEIEANSTFEDDFFQSVSLLKFSGKQFPIHIDCYIERVSAEARKFNGTMSVKDKTYQIGGEANIIGELPVKLLITLIPENNGQPVSFQYSLTPTLQGYELDGSVQNSEKVTRFKANATTSDKFNWDFNLEVLPPKTSQKISVIAQALSDTSGYKLDITGTSQIPKLENPKCGIKYSPKGELNTVYGYFEVTAAKGSVTLDFIWKLLENMYVNVIGQYQNYEYSSQSRILAFYENPEKLFHFLKVGGDIKVDSLWQSAANVTIKLPQNRTLNIEGHFKVPNDVRETHSLSGDFAYGDRFSFVNYLLKYRCTHPLRKYGTWAEIVLEDKKNMSGKATLEWDGREYHNYGNLRKFDKTLNVVYKLKTPKFPNKHLFVTDINYNQLENHHNLTCELFYPENHRVTFATVDYVELANMDGMFNISVPYKGINYTGAYFQTETNDKVYNRYVRVFWDKETAIVDSKCNIKTGNTLSERHSKGKLIAELPLATRHIAIVDYEYDKKPLLSTGFATVEYNGTNVLEAKYNCLSETEPHLSKDTIHMELLNKMVPLGADYIHRHQLGIPEKPSTLILNTKSLHLYHLENRTKFNVTGELHQETTEYGQKFLLSATHSNRTVNLWTDYALLSQRYNQHTRLELNPTTWIEYDLNIVNNTEDDVFDAQLILINVSYPRRNFKAEGFYNISDSIVLTDVSLVWDKDNKTVQAGLDWRRASPHREQLQFQIKHPTFERDVTFLTEYGFDNSSLDGHLTVDYSLDPDKRLTLGAKVQDVSDIKTYNYTYSIWAEHNATSLYLSSSGDIYWNPDKCGTEHVTDYKRSYLGLSRSEAFARVNFDENEVEFKKDSTMTGSTYFRGKYAGEYPLYTANVSAVHSIKHTNGEFYLNFRKKLLYLDVNMTEDGSQSLHTYGIIPNARSIQFDIWRDYDDKKVSDVSYYLKLNHSRLIMSSLRWRPDLIKDVQNGVRSRAMQFYQGVLEEINNTRQYIRAESLDELDRIWQDAKPFVENFLVDLRNITVIEDDFDILKEFLNNSYNANEFYIKDISTVLLSMFDELSLKSHLQSVPQIIQEIWDVMGESGQKIKKSINFVIEKIKSYYKSTTQFIHDLINGDPIKQLSSVLEKVVEKYDTIIKNLHVSVLQHMEKLWTQTYDLMVENWHKTLAALEPTFLKFIHYLETIAWTTGKDFLDFLYIRKNKIIESAYFMEFSKFSKDFDSFYKDITGNNTIEAIHKYGNVAWNFIQEKYINHIPFGKELQAILLEIWNELEQLNEIPSIKYLISKYHEGAGYIKYYYKYFEVDYRIHRLIRLIYSKISDMAVTAIEVENRQREAKTKFIFEPHDGVMLLEQKLPMSWHAFNETPKLQEIPEVKIFYDIHSYLTASTTSFWDFYYNFKPYTDPSDWLPPFKGHAMIIGNNYYVTFDKKYYNFEGSCSYLLATDMVDKNFTLVRSYDQDGTNELILMVHRTIVRINMAKNSIKIGDAGIQRLPVEIGDTYIYLDADILRAESSSGFILECNMKFHICEFQISGWYFGKTAGLWGTYNNEPYDDFLSSNKIRLNASNFDEFADSWSLNKNCESKNIEKPTENKQTKPISSEIFLMCNEFYNSKVSQLSTCFKRVSKDYFYDICLKSTSTEDVCRSVIAYIGLCNHENTPMRIPDTCVKCNLLNGTEVLEGYRSRIQGDAIPATADVVFIVEAKLCNKNLKESKNFNILVSLINQELAEAQVTDNRYAVVVFGGDGVYDLPRSIVVDGNTFTDANSILNYFNNIPVGDGVYDQPRSIFVDGNTFTDANSILNYFNNIPVGNGSQDIYNAIIYATKLLFRPTVSKNFILIPCSECHEGSMEQDYSILHQVLFENEVSLHILMKDPFSLQAGEARKRENKIPFGIDLEKAYSKKDVKGLIGDQVLRSSISLPKSSLGPCLSLAFETNGTIFTASHLENQKNAKKLATVFAKRFVQSALNRDCTDCECTGDNTGIAYMECYPCIYPRSHFNTDHGNFDDDNANDQ